jgi:hypothetical protein
MMNGDYEFKKEEENIRRMRLLSLKKIRRS